MRSSVQEESLSFRQSPTFADCFPASTKEYREVLHEPTSTLLKVPSSTWLGPSWGAALGGTLPFL